MGKYAKKSNYWGRSADHEWSRNRTPLTDVQRDLAGRSLGLAGTFANQNERRYAGQLTRDELFSVACEGLVLAARGFRPDNGIAFSTYAFMVMRRRAGLEVRNNHVIRVAVHSRYPDEVRAVRGGFVHMGDAAMDIVDRPASDYDAVDLADLDAGLARLDERSRDIVLRQADGSSLSRIGEVYRLSSERVRQIAVEAIGRLRRRLVGRGDTSCV